jgi:cytochrome bd-type quinol oxidase subunit 2
MNCDACNGLVYFALAAFVVVIIVAAWLIKTTPETADIEAKKIRFAAATFTGILMLLVLIIILYYTSDRGKEIFERVLAAVTTLIGAIAGYLFGSRGSGRGAGQGQGAAPGNPGDKKPGQAGKPLT